MSRRPGCGTARTTPAGDEQVGSAVVVDVADGDAVAVAAGAWPAMPGRSVTSSNVPSPRLRKSRSPSRGRVGLGREGSALDGVDVEPAVAVVVEQRRRRRSSSRGAAGTATGRSRT